MRILCEISVDTLVYQCVKLLWVFLGVGGLVRRTGGEPDKPSKEPPGGSTRIYCRQGGSRAGVGGEKGISAEQTLVQRRREEPGAYCRIYRRARGRGALAEQSREG